MKTNWYISLTLAVASAVLLTSCSSVSEKPASATTGAVPAPGSLEQKAKPGAEKSGPVLLFDGIYRAQTIRGEPGYPSFRFIRFYPDGVVIAGLSTARPQDLQNWFNREHKIVSRGTYTISGENIEFTTKWHVQSKRGVENFRGQILRNGLRLRTRIESVNPPTEWGPYDYEFIEWPTGTPTAGTATNRAAAGTVPVNPPPSRPPAPAPRSNAVHSP